VLLGRELEQQELRRLFDAARRGMSGVLVVRGDGGIGKTALFEDVIASETGVHATRVSGFEAEMELSFAERHLEQILRSYACHYNGYRPYQWLTQEIPEPERTGRPLANRGRLGFPVSASSRSSGPDTSIRPSGRSDP
jgi:hypothetical protein